MDNRFNNFGFNNMSEEPEPTPISLDLKPHERVIKITLELEDADGLLDEDLPEDFVGEAFIEQELVVRGREFNAFVNVLHYNKIRYRTETIQ